jgi:hypothetical protein
LVIDRALAVRDAWRAQNPRSEFQIDREFEPIFERSWLWSRFANRQNLSTRGK